MADLEHTCRICRGEGTPSQPLYHPCKCRGSIKYIHQDCLLEWLKHSNKSNNEKCDICNTPYRFKIIYDPNMPKKIPLSLVWLKFVQTVSSTFTKSTSIALYVACIIIQVPIFWMFCGRVYTWAIDGSLPENNPKVLDALYYGNYNLRAVLSNMENLTPALKTLTEWRVFFSYTYFTGLRHLVILLIVHIALFVEREWVIRDEGYLKLLNRKIGREPKTKLVNMLQNAIQGLREQQRNRAEAEGRDEMEEGERREFNQLEAAQNLQRLDMLTKAIEDLQNQEADEQANNELHENLRRAIIRGELFHENHDAEAQEQEQQQQQQQREEEEEENENENEEIGVINNTNIVADGDEDYDDEDDDEDADYDENRSYTDDDDADNEHTDDGTDNDTDNESSFSHRGEDGDDDLEIIDENDYSIVDIDERPEVFGFDQNNREAVAAAVASEEEDDVDDDDHLNIGGHHNHLDDVEDFNFDDHQRDDDDDDDVDEEEEEEEDDDDDDLRAGDANANQNGFFAEILDMFGVVLNIKTPLILMVICDAIIVAYLFVIYLIPQLLGSIIAYTTGYIWLFFAYFLPSTVYESVLSFSQQYKTIETGYDIVDLLYNSLVKYCIIPAITLLKDVFFKPRQLTVVERSIHLIFGYGLICGAIYKSMKMLASNPKPLVGNARKAYKILFEITSTAKVFTVFGIEIFVFPLYCGYLVDFCLAAITNEDQLLFTTSNEFTQLHWVRMLFRWSSGTFYMLMFALFIGMVRTKILRPGVLFFIRSPDDQNARLIHDALMKPMGLQLSRIYLSAKVYTGFILVGIGGVTWGLRYFVSRDGKGVLLPIQFPTTAFIVFAVLVTAIAESQPIITKYARLYWTRAFELSAHKLRLSHFVLGKPILYERGYTIYRNIYQRFVAQPVPDYSHPVTYREAQSIFQSNPSVHACFVPDGNYVRAPDNDTVSRKFIKKLFVPVTKDDKLLREIDEADLQRRSGYETPTSEDEDDATSDDAYAIVYRPPNFKVRCFALIFMLWIFSVVLLLPIAMIALLFGRPFIVATVTIAEQIKPGLSGFGNANWKLADLASLSCGLFLLLKLLVVYDQKMEADAGRNEVREEEAAAAAAAAVVADVGAGAGAGAGVGAGNVGAGANAAQPENGQNPLQVAWEFNREMFNRIPWALPLLALISGLWSVYVALVHKFCIDDALFKYMGISITDPSLKALFVHFIASWWTVFPVLRRYLVNAQLNVLRGNLSLHTFLKRTGVYTLVYNCSMHAIFYFAFQYGLSKYANFTFKDVDDLVIVRMLAFLAFISVQSFTRGLKFYFALNDQVRQEKFVKGRAIVNDNTETL